MGPRCSRLLEPSFCAIYGRGQGLFCRHALGINATVECLVMDACFLSPFHHGLGFALEGEEMVAAAVAVLLAHCGPVAVIFRVALVIVFAIYRHAWGALAHIGQKLAKVQPCLADGNAASTPVSILRSVGVRTALDHASPGIVRPAPFARVRVMPVLRLGFTDTFPHVATAGGRSATNKITPRGCRSTATCAVTQPQRMFAAFACIGTNREASVGFAGEVVKIVSTTLVFGTLLVSHVACSYSASDVVRVVRCLQHRTTRHSSTL